MEIEFTYDLGLIFILRLWGYGSQENHFYGALILFDEMPTHVLFLNGRTLRIRKLKPLSDSLFRFTFNVKNCSIAACVWLI